MAGLGDGGLAILVEPVPLLLAHHHVHREVLALIRAEFVGDVIDPAKLLGALAPVAAMFVVGAARRAAPGIRATPSAARRP